MLPDFPAAETAERNKVTMRLRSKKNVQWGDDVVDNESLGRKKSKKCCIFHKRRRFGESSSESEGYSSSSGGEAETPSRRNLTARNECNCKELTDRASSSADLQAASSTTRRRPFTQRLQEPETAIVWGAGSTPDNRNADSMEVNVGEKQMTGQSAI